MPILCIFVGRESKEITIQLKFQGGKGKNDEF